MSPSRIRRYAVGGAALAAIAIATALTSFAQSRPKPIPMAVYKTASCGCCTKWVEYMQVNGFDVKVQNVENIGALKLKLGVRPEFSSCHTAQVGDYIVEGHVPVEVVTRMLKERPKIAGIAVPNMPAGSPGMEVPDGRKDRYDILAFTSDGKTTVYDKR
jgi:hypothetical protein